MKTHTEDSFEQLIVEHLVLHGGFEPRGRSTFDPDDALASKIDCDIERALIPSDLIAFIKATQPKPWAKLQAIHADKLQASFLNGLCKAMDQQGALQVLRHGFKFYGQLIRPAIFAPGHGLNPEVQALYDANRVRVVRQLRYDPRRPDKELDLALFINGLPIATVELKNAMTGQQAGHAKQQYRQDRDPKAPIFRFKQRALVHFAVDADQAWMTTELRGASTVFLPFNRGKDHGAGNPAVEGKHRTCYLWEEVWQRDSLLELVGRFIHLQKSTKTNPDTGKRTTSERMIFPRYHQRDCVLRLVKACRKHGAGTNYLVQHSAGSGKSNSIAWLAHRLASLHDADDHKVYDSVVVLTDRQVLDQQLQDTIYQFEHKTGVVEKIDKNSAQLAAALTGGVPIIISTIHKFGFIQDTVGKLPDRRYAIIVDEAHSSQSGDMAVKVKELLADSTVEAQLAADSEDLSVPDQLALRAALFRGPQANMSFFAFTDGHLLPYTGKEKLHYSYNTQRRMPVPGRTNQVTCDGSGRIVDFEIHEGKGAMKQWILEVVDRWRTHLPAPPVAVFDREGYDAGFFSRLVSDGRPFVSWEKNVDTRRLAAIDAQRFTTDFTFNGKRYSVFEQPKKFSYTPDEQGEQDETHAFTLRHIHIWNHSSDRRTCALVHADLPAGRQVPRC